MSEPSVPNNNWQQVAALRDIPLIEQAIARLEASGRDASEWYRLLLRTKRWLHIPYREE